MSPVLVFHLPGQQILKDIKLLSMKRRSLFGVALLDAAAVNPLNRGVVAHFSERTNAMNMNGKSINERLKKRRP